MGSHHAPHARRVRACALLALVGFLAIGAQAQTVESPAGPVVAGPGPTRAASPAEAGTRAAAPRLQPSEPVPLPELEAFVDGVVRAEMDQRHIAGVAVAVVQDGTIALKKGYGFASIAERRPVDPDATLFRIGSITKTFTWIAVMKAVEDGLLDLDAPVNTYLPADVRIPDEGFSRSIRMRDLMTHSPGFADPALGILFERDPQQIRPLERFLRETRPARVREPGELTSYSNYGVALAGAVVQQLRGAAWQDVIEREILTPLGMTRTTGREPYPARDDLPAPMPASLARDVSTGYRWTGEAHAARSFEFITHIGPAGVMSSTAADMARYMLMLLGGGTLDDVTVFGPATAEAFRTPMTMLPPAVGSVNAGFFELPFPGGFRGYGHSGGTLSFFTNMMVVPELRLGVFVATNTEGGEQLSDRLPWLIVDRFYAPPAERPAPSPDAGELRRLYAGSYLQTRRPYRGLEDMVMRLLQIPVSVTPDGFLSIPAFGQRHRLAPADTPETFAGIDAPLGVVFDREGDRPAHRMRHVSMAFDRVGAFYRTETLALFAALTTVLSAGTIVGVLRRIRRRLPATGSERLAAGTTAGAALLWLTSIMLFAIWGMGASDIANVIYDWPAPLVVAASSAALLASVATLAAAIALPLAWRGNGRDAGWSLWRKLRVATTVLVFVAFAALLGA